MTEKKLYSWGEANLVAQTLKEKLETHCEPDRCMIVGSLRRQCEFVHDIDIVLQPRYYPPLTASMFEIPGVFQEKVSYELDRIIGEGWHKLRGKGKIINGLYCDIPVDLYFATQEQWWTLVAIRTGSKEHNIKLCKRARNLRMKLHADGSGLEFEGGTRYTPKSEDDVFAQLGLAYLEPKDR
jgi:DNA polymerase/3'-5' exonuclease PolX